MNASQVTNLHIAYVYMYIENTENYPNPDLDEFSCYLFGHDLEEIKKLFTVAVHQTGIAAEDLAVIPMLITKTAGKYAVSTHLKVAAFEEKAIFTPKDIDPTLTVDPNFMSKFISALLSSNGDQNLIQSKMADLYGHQPIAV